MLDQFREQRDQDSKQGDLAYLFGQLSCLLSSSELNRFVAVHRMVPIIMISSTKVGNTNSINVKRRDIATSPTRSRH